MLKALIKGNWRLKKSYSANIVSAVLNFFTNINMQKYHCHVKNIKLKIRKTETKTH